MAVCFKSNKNKATLLGTILIFLNMASCFGASNLNNLVIPIAGIMINIILVLSISSQSSCLITVCVVFQCIQIVINLLGYGFLLMSFLSSGYDMSNKLSLPVIVILLGNSILYIKISLLVIN